MTKETVKTILESIHGAGNVKVATYRLNNKVVGARGGNKVYSIKELEALCA
jgi:hypothetical protein